MQAMAKEEQTSSRAPNIVSRDQLLTSRLDLHSSGNYVYGRNQSIRKAKDDPIDRQLGTPRAVP